MIKIAPRKMCDTRDARRKVNKVRWETDKRSGSSRASTVGGSSTTSSGYSGTASYEDPRYNIAALQQTLEETVSDLDHWKNKAIDAEEKLLKCQKEQKETEARVSALTHANATLGDDNKELQRQVRALKRDNIKDLEREVKSLGEEIESLEVDKKELKEKNARLQKKLDKLDSRSEPSSPDNSKPRRSDSKRSKEAEQNARLKDRLNKHSGDSLNGETVPSKPPSSSKTPHRSRRTSTSGERPYVENWGPISPNTGSTRRPDNYIAMNGYPSTSVSSTPRSMRPSVEIPYHTSTFHEDGNYHLHHHPLPPKQ